LACRCGRRRTLPGAADSSNSALPIDKAKSFKGAIQRNHNGRRTVGCVQ
jgi:hypothetical protein